MTVGAAAPDASDETMVRAYPDRDAYWRDAAVLARGGWVVVGSIGRKPWAGWLRVPMPARLRKPGFVVTYQRVR